MALRIRIKNGKSEPRPAAYILPGRQPSWKKVVEIGLIALLIFSPLPQGSAWEWSILVIQLTAVGLALIYLAGNRDSYAPAWRKPMRGPRWLITGFFLLVLLQVIPLPAFLVKILAPGSYHFHQAYGPQSPGSAFLTISLVPASTLRAGLELLAYVLAAMLLLRVINRFRQMERMVTVLILLGVFQALYGLFELSTAQPHILFYKKLYNLDSVTGTFVNRNHLAGYLEMIIPLALGFLVARIGFFSLRVKGSPGAMREIFAHFSRKSFAVNLLLAAATVVMAVAVVKSQSRAGVFLMVLTFLLFLEMVLFHLSYSGEGRRLARNLINVSFLVVVIFSLAVGMTAVMNRFLADDTLFHGGRTLFWRNIVPLVRDFPLFGTGLGTFVSVYPGYETAGIGMLLEHAHNDYLELAAETGILGFLLLAGGIVWTLVQIFRMWRARRSLEIKGLAMGGFISCVVILIHSFTDFNLHIPANALVFTMVLALTTAIVHRRSSTLSREEA
ncbi:MAG: O-antigen ligase family protein [Candidatus Aminicenantales bacterium]